MCPSVQVIIQCCVKLNVISKLLDTTFDLNTNVYQYHIYNPFLYVLIIWISLQGNSLYNHHCGTVIRMLDQNIKLFPALLLTAESVNREE